jgi:NADPH:quinone reductase-like Zn-dependent oxidoreductase
MEVGRCFVCNAGHCDNAFDSGNDANPENGAFAKYISVKGDLQMHISDNMSFEEAATVGVGIGTTGYALYRVPGLPYPTQTAASSADSKTRPQILIYGGSTATGTIAIQLAKLLVILHWDNLVILTFHLQLWVEGRYHVISKALRHDEG